MGNVEGFESLYSVCVIPNLIFFFFCSARSWTLTHLIPPFGLVAQIPFQHGFPLYAYIMLY